MASSPYTTSQYTSEEFVESCGAIVFDLSQNKTVCLVHYQKTNEWLLAKGRRNCGESRYEAALREFHEETGYRARLCPVKMWTRAPPKDEEGCVQDIPRLYPDLTEPFMVTTRQLGGSGVKIIWWYIAVLEGFVGEPGSHEKEFSSRFFPLDEAVEMLSFENDRSVLRKAISIIEG
ncbi:NUDIX domain [Penicillium brevicompactum]|uniref:NUDIX domain n=1 Tax=Penicillium brevicompactum TaxID=5074 RepID=UPI00253F8454|nr:NUDIX domain [Penicillium brevicompactum]KAJ5333745.1 NUDIX domain [Penicillium brevicompactum]